MNKSEKTNVQINISIPRAWRDQLNNLAHIYSVEEEHTVTIHELMRRGIKEKYQLEDNDNE